LGVLAHIRRRPDRRYGNTRGARQATRVVPSGFSTSNRSESIALAIGNNEKANYRSEKLDWADLGDLIRLNSLSLVTGVLAEGGTPG
jgi:hypothetical protein